MSSKGITLGFKAELLYSLGEVDGKSVDIINEWMSTTKIPALSDEQVILFLISCDNNVEFTKKTIEAYHQIKNSLHEVFTDRKLNGIDIQSALRSGHFCTWRNQEGYVFIYYGFKANSEEWNFKSCVKLSLMAIECLTYDYPPKGLYVLTDTNEINFSKATKIFYSRLVPTILNYLQEAAPIKLKEMHVFNSSYFMYKMLQILKPFLNIKILEQLHLHPKSLQWDNFYHKYLPKISLPNDFGGDLPSINVLTERTIQKMADIQTYYDTEELWVKNM